MTQDMKKVRFTKLYVILLVKNIMVKQEKKEYDKKRGHIYYKNNKEEVDKKNKKNNSIKILCECGALIRKDSMYRHIISKKHIKLLEEKST